MDLIIALLILDKSLTYTILIGGTSGCGKSTLATLLSTRLGIFKVVSTDTIREQQRKLSDNPLLWASSYFAGELIHDPSLTQEQLAIRGYEEQNDLLFPFLHQLISDSCEPMVVEGVHLSVQKIKQLNHSRVISFIIYLSDKVKRKPNSFCL